VLVRFFPHISSEGNLEFFILELEHGVANTTAAALPEPPWREEPRGDRFTGRSFKTSSDS
jgi:hypothetical protein